MPGVQATSGRRTLTARRRSRSLSQTSYTSANPPRPSSRRTSYLGPSAVLSRAWISASERGCVMRGRSGHRHLHFRRVLPEAGRADALGPVSKRLLARGHVGLLALPGLERLVLERPAAGERQLPWQVAQRVHRVEVVRSYLRRLPTRKEHDARYREGHP